MQICMPQLPAHCSPRLKTNFVVFLFKKLGKLLEKVTSYTLNQVHLPAQHAGKLGSERQ